MGTEASTETRGVLRQGTETRGGRAPRQDTETRGDEAPTRHRDKARRQGSVEELGFVIQVGGLGHNLTKINIPFKKEPPVPGSVHPRTSTYLISLGEIF